MVVSNLLIIAGTGNKSGKTSMACRLISQFKDKNVVSVKITPHFHETTPGLAVISEQPGYSVYEETNKDTEKDTSRMLRAGASKVYFAKVTDNFISEAFGVIFGSIPEGSPVICESPALRYYAEPAVFIIMTSTDKNNQKDINNLLKLPHVSFNMNDLHNGEQLPVVFKDGLWSCWQYGR